MISCTRSYEFRDSRIGSRPVSKERHTGEQEAPVRPHSNSLLMFSDLASEKDRRQGVRRGVINAHHEHQMVHVRYLLY